VIGPAIRTARLRLPPSDTHTTLIPGVGWHRQPVPAMPGLTTPPSRSPSGRAAATFRVNRQASLCDEFGGVQSSQW